MGRPHSLRIGRVLARPVRGPDDQGRWYWRCDVGAGERRRVAWSGWASTSDVAEQAVRLDALVGRSAGPADQPPARLLGDVFGMWSEAQARRPDLTDRTRAFYDRMAGHLAAHLGNLPLAVPSLHDLEGYRDARLLAGIAPQTVKQELAVLKRVWGWARQARLVPDLDLPRVVLRVRARRSRRTPTPDEVEAVLPALDGWARLATAVLCATGARIGEVAGVTRGDVDAHRSQLRLDGKTGERWVPIPKELAARLAWSPGEGVFGVVAETVRCSLGRHLAKACDDTGVPRFTPHALRRMVLDQLYASGADVGTVAALLGQSPEVALRHYRQSTEAERQRAVHHADLGRVVKAALP